MIDFLTIYIAIGFSTIGFGQSTFSPIKVDFSGVENPFVDSTYSDFQWTLRDSKTATANTGPSNGHTPCTGSPAYCNAHSQDYYAYIETSSPQKSGEYALMYAPQDISPSSCVKVQFWFHGYGSSLGSLSVVHGSDTYGWKVVDTVPRRSENAWRQHTTTIASANDNWKVGFKGVVGNSYKGDYAIDDIVISDCNYVASPTTTTTLSPDQTKPEHFVVGDGSYFSYYTHGSIYGGNYPDGYNRECASKYWVILAERHERIRVEIKDLFIYSRDKLRFFDMKYGGMKIYDLASNQLNYYTLQTNTHQLNISFECYYSRYRIRGDYTGFHIDWSLEDEQGNSLPQTIEAPGSEMPMSSGTIIGIVVGCVAAVLLIAIIVCGYFCCCKKKPHNSGAVVDARPFTTAGGAYPVGNYGQPVTTVTSGYAQPTSHVFTANQSYTNQPYASYTNQVYAQPAYNTAPSQHGTTGYIPPPGYNQTTNAAPPTGYNGYNVPPAGANQSTNATSAAQSGNAYHMNTDGQPATAGMPPGDGALPPPPAYETVGTYDFGATPSAPVYDESSYQMPKTS